MSNCMLCRRFVGSVTITVVGTDLVVNIPSNTYNNGTRICLGLLQELPDTATINMPVVITIGAGTTQYPLIKCNGTPVVASDVDYRSVYKLKVQTTSTTAVFRVLNGLCCSTQNTASAPSIGGA